MDGFLTVVAKPVRRCASISVVTKFTALVACATRVRRHCRSKVYFAVSDSSSPNCAGHAHVLGLLLDRGKLKNDTPRNCRWRLPDPRKTVERKKRVGAAWFIMPKGPTSRFTASGVPKP